MGVLSGNTEMICRIQKYSTIKQPEMKSLVETQTNDEVPSL